MDASPSGHLARRRSRTRLFVDEARQELLSTTLVFDRARAAGGADLWQLHVTAIPAGGSRSQQAIRAIREQSRFPRRVHHGSASERRLADAEQY